MTRVVCIFAFLAFSVAAFGQSVCSSPATGRQPYSLVPGSNGKPTYVPGALNEALGYIPQPYVALPGEPTDALAFCGPAWQPNYSYQVGNMIQLPDGTVMQAVSCGPGGCLSGSSAPAEFSGPLFWPSPGIFWVSTCSDTGSTATCDTVSATGDSAPVNIGEPYEGANVGGTMVIVNYGPDPNYNRDWPVTASTGSKPFSFSFTATGLGSGDCTSLVGGTTVCLTFQQGSRVKDNSIVWQDVGGQNEKLLTPLVDVVPASSTITTQETLAVTVTVGAGTGVPPPPAPTGKVTLSSPNYTSPATSLSNGSATITIPAGALSVGTDTLTAKYSGDTKYALASGFNSVTVTSVGTGFSIRCTDVTVNAGATSGNTSTITVTPMNGFTGSVTLTASVSPDPAQHPPTFSFGSTSPVDITGPSAVTATLTISTTAPTMGALAYPTRPGDPRQNRVAALFAVIVALLLGAGIPTRRRGWRVRVGALALLVAFIGGLLACSSSAGGGNSGTPPGSYTVAVRGTSGSTEATGTFTLIVQ